MTARKAPLSVLITSGGTREYLDGIRYLGNISSGRTGAGIAADLLEQGCRVVLLRAVDAAPAPAGSVSQEFCTFSELEAALRQILSTEKIDAVVHAAAVSDYAIDFIETGGERRQPGRTGKLDSSAPPVIHLKTNPKLLEQLKSFAAPRPVLVVGFKLTNTTDRSEQLRALKKCLDRGGVDFIVHNDLSGIDAASGIHKACIYDSALEQAASCTTSRQLGEALCLLIEQNCPES